MFPTARMNEASLRHSAPTVHRPLLFRHDIWRHARCPCNFWLKESFWNTISVFVSRCLLAIVANHELAINSSTSDPKQGVIRFSECQKYHLKYHKPCTDSGDISGGHLSDLMLPLEPQKALYKTLFHIRYSVVLTKARKQTLKVVGIPL